MARRSRSRLLRLISTLLAGQRPDYLHLVGHDLGMSLGMVVSLSHHVVAVTVADRGGERGGSQARDQHS